MNDHGAQQDERINALDAKVRENGWEIEALKQQVAEMEQWKAECNCKTVDIDPPVVEPAPKPEPPATTPTPPAVDAPNYPTPTHIIEVKGGQTTDISDKLKKGVGEINLVIGPRDAIVRLRDSDVGRCSVIFDGCTGYSSNRYGGAKFIEGRSDGFVWMNDFHYEGREIQSDGIDTFRLANGFSKLTIVNSQVRKVRRVLNGCGSHEAYNLICEDIWEDFAQGSVKVRNATVLRMGYPIINPRGAHPDVIQAATRCDIDGLLVDTYSGPGQGIAFSSDATNGSVIKNVEFRNAGPENRGSGVMIQSVQGHPSNILFENVKMDKAFFIRPEGDRYGWKGQNIRMLNCQFSNRNFVDEVING